MANKRNIKKEIKYICGDIAGECILAREFIEGIDAKKMNDIIIRIADLQTHALKNVSFSFDKSVKNFDSIKEYHKAKRQYNAQAYANFRENFNNSLSDIVKAMNGLLPNAQREENKKAAQNQ